MRRILIVGLLIIAGGCNNKSIEFYKSSFQKNKSDYFFIRDKCHDLLDVKDSLYKFGVEFTGKRFIEYPFINDTTIFSFYGVKLKESDNLKMSAIMYDLGLQYVFVYRDSTKYIFSGMHKDTLVIYRSDVKKISENVIDTNTFLIFEKR